MLQVSIGMLAFISILPGLSALPLILLAVIGGIITIIGVYFLVSWFNSDKPQTSRFA